MDGCRTGPRPGFRTADLTPVHLAPRGSWWAGLRTFKLTGWVRPGR